MAQRILRRHLIGSDKRKMPGLAFHKPAMPNLFGTGIHKLAWFPDGGLSAYVSIERIGSLNSCFVCRSWWQSNLGASAIS
jgi:hypothetical protein